MEKFFATVIKELRLLFRDKSGLLVLFLMPAALVAVISLVQENVLQTTGDAGVQVLFVNSDDGEISKTLQAHLAESGAVELIFTLNGRPPDENAAKKAVSDGKYAFCIMIPKGFTEMLTNRAQKQVASAFSESTEDTDTAAWDAAADHEMTVFFDPLVQGHVRAAVISALHRVMLIIEMEIKGETVSHALSEQIRQTMSGMPDGAGPMFPLMDASWSRTRLSEIREKQAVFGGLERLPTSVQQNVPAYGLFGMFFIVLPLSGSLIRERRDGVMIRLLSMPVSRLTLLSGKMTAYTLVCGVQFIMIICMGKWVMPLMGTPVLEMGQSPAAVVLIVLSAGLAACGYGILLGTVARTYEQASMFGPVSVVIAAALGGIMVPVYVMPETMRAISQYSPLAWGLNAFIEIFVKNGGVEDILREVGYLLAFFAVNLLAAWMVFRQRGGIEG